MGNAIIDRDDRSEIMTEEQDRMQRVTILSAKVQQLFPGEDPQTVGLLRQIEESFRVPQYGPHHHEGMFMDSHLDLILKTLEKLKRGEFPEEIPVSIRSTLQTVAMQSSETLERYTFLHDISKKDCLTVKYNDGRSKEFTWEEWQAQFADETKDDPVALRTFCEDQSIKGISYYHSGEGGQHGITGRRALEQLGYTGVSAPVLTAIEKHEVAYQFTGISPDTYKKHLGGLSPEERDLALTASYIDTSASLTLDQQPDYSNFVALVQSRHNFEIINRVEAALTENIALDKQKVTKAIADLRKLKERLSDSAEDIAHQLEKSCRPTQYDPEKLRGNLASLIASSTITDAEAEEIIGYVVNGRASEIGRKFGKKMKEIGPALKASEKVSTEFKPLEEVTYFHVDDNRGFQDRAKQELQEILGIENRIGTAQSVPEAIREIEKLAIQNQPIDVIMLDQRFFLHEGDERDSASASREFLERFTLLLDRQDTKEALKNTIVIMYSGTADNKFVEAMQKICPRVKRLAQKGQERALPATMAVQLAEDGVISPDDEKVHRARTILNQPN